MSAAGSTNPVSYKAVLTICESAAETVADALSQAGSPKADAVARFDAGPGRAEISAYYDAKPDRPAIEGLIAAVLPPGISVPDLRVETVTPLDWVAESQRLLHPVRAGRFIIHGHHDRPRLGGRPGAIEIEAGQAFGTAHHGTTRGCLIALSHLAKRGRLGEVLDLGTGSGVLAIAAAKAGAASVVATDVDAVAADVAARNARLNGVRQHIRLVRSEGLDHRALRAPRAYDCIFANLLARPLIRLAPGIARILRPGGHIVLSGLTPDQAPRVNARYRSHGFVLRSRLLIENWATLLLARRS